MIDWETIEQQPSYSWRSEDGLTRLSVEFSDGDCVWMWNVLVLPEDWRTSSSYARCNRSGPESSSEDARAAAEKCYLEWLATST